MANPHSHYARDAALMALERRLRNRQSSGADKFSSTIWLGGFFLNKDAVLPSRISLSLKPASEKPTVQ